MDVAGEDRRSETALDKTGKNQKKAVEDGRESGIYFGTLIPL